MSRQNFRMPSMTFWQMHEIPRSLKGIKGAVSVLAALLLLFLIPVLFRSPATTFADPLSLAVHAYQLSLSDSIAASNLLPDLGNAGSLWETIFLGSYDIYPFRIFTARQSQTGAAIMRIQSRSDYLDREMAATMDDREIEMIPDGGSMIVMVRTAGEPSWSEEVLSIITNR